MNNLKLHLKLNEQVDDEFVDSSDHQHTIISTEDTRPTLQTDSQFPKVADFDGLRHHLQLPNADILGINNSGFTVETWIKMGSNLPIAHDSTILWIDSPEFAVVFQLAMRNQTLMLVFNSELIRHTKKLRVEQWYHLACTFEPEDKQIRLYIDGVLALSHPVTEGIQSGRSVYVGKVVLSHYFYGRLYDLRIYDTALSPAEIKGDMFSSLLESESDSYYNYLLDFALFAKNQENTLFVADHTPRQSNQVCLNVINNIAESLVLEDLTNTKLDKNNYHFCLSFESGVLSKDSLAGANPVRLSPESRDKWNLFILENDAGKDRLYLSSKSAANSIEPESTVSIYFDRLNANPWEESGESEVELQTNHVYHQQSREEPEEFEENQEFLQIHRSHHLHVLNHFSNQPNRLHIGFFGSNKVRNDGNTANELTLKITNQVIPSENYPQAGQLVFHHGDKSQIILWFAMGAADGIETLATAEEIRQVQVVPPRGWQVKPSSPEEQPHWILTPESEDQILQGHDYLLIPLTNITTSYPEGSSYLNVAFENVENHEQEVFRVPIEKERSDFNVAAMEALLKKVNSLEAELAKLRGG